tara:strand:- start:19 stop:489 length:471 start_codon:yes stop_codon:yes gene_type:complete
MNYSIDISFDLRKHNFTQIKNTLINLSKKYESYRYYCDFELSGLNKVITRNHCVITFIFEDFYTDKFILFIKEIKKISRVYIECVYNDYNIIYASKKYLKMLSKYEYEKYKEELNKNKNESNLIYKNICNINSNTNTNTNTNTNININSLIKIACS